MSRVLKIGTDIGAGVYTPTLTPVTNCTVTLTSAFWFSTGAFVQVYVAVLVDPVATGVTVFDISFPFPFDITAQDQAIGLAVSTAESGFVEADVANNRFSVTFTAVSTAEHKMNVCAAYRLQ